MLNYLVEAVMMAFLCGGIVGIFVGAQMTSQRIKLKPATQKIHRDR